MDDLINKLRNTQNKSQETVNDSNNIDKENKNDISHNTIESSCLTKFHTADNFDQKQQNVPGKSQKYSNCQIKDKNTQDILKMTERTNCRESLSQSTITANDNASKVTNCGESLSQSTITTNDSIKKLNKSSEEINEDTFVDIRTSQSDFIDDRRFQLDFNLLRRKRESDHLTVLEAKKMTELRLFKPLYGMIKSVEMFGDIYKWEICDETGIINGSAYVRENTVKVGDAVQLCDCALWKFDENHLNIVYENIKGIYSWNGDKDNN